jgi:hypothetical protein
MEKFIGSVPVLLKSANHALFNSAKGFLLLEGFCPKDSPKPFFGCFLCHLNSFQTFFSDGWD